MFLRGGFILSLLLLAPSCATKVYHASKTAPEMQADINLCSDEANRRYWMDPVAALYHAYDCLEAKGYTREQATGGGKVQRAVSERYKGIQPGEVCQVPCRRPSTGS